MFLLAGMVGGGTFEYARTAYSNPDKVRVRRIKAVYNVSVISGVSPI